MGADDSSSVVAASMAPSSAEALSESGYFAESNAGSQSPSAASESVIGGKCHSPFQLAAIPRLFSIETFKMSLCMWLDVN